jgi:HK97 gp10 family phage protein
MTKAKVTWNAKAWDGIAPYVDQIVKDGAELAAKQIKKNIPVSNEPDDVILKNSLRTYQGKNKKESVRYIVEVGGRGEWGNADYAAHVEFGTRKMAPNPYIRKEKKNIRRKFAALVRRRLKEINLIK